MCGHTHTCAIHNTVLKNKGRREKKRRKIRGKEEKRE
jgi:hypothetical protein